MSSKAGGHFALGWKTPNATAFEVVPSAVLAVLQADPQDLNDNHLPDDFENETGLATSTLPGALAEHGDPDLDGINNLEEYQNWTDPLEKNVLSGGLTRDSWQELQGQQVSRLIGARARFLSHPNSTTHVPNIDENRPGKLEGKDYGARYRGYLTAPATGTYRLWVAGDDEAELWFSDGTVVDPISGESLTNKFGKQLLAHTRNPGGNYSSPPRDFDLIPSQRTRALNLVEGETYYIEVLHKNESIAGNHVSVAWEYPGQARTIIPSSAFHSDFQEPSDAENDNLPDAWETIVGLSITDNGILSNKQGEHGDFDGDGLSNLLEFQLGTDPKLADTDGDGLSDDNEVYYYRTDPLVPNTIATTTTANASSQHGTSTPNDSKANPPLPIQRWDRAK